MDSVRRVHQLTKKQARQIAVFHDRGRTEELFEFEYSARDVQAGGESAAGATSRCRSSTATGWSGTGRRRPIARPAVLRVRAIHEDPGFSPALTKAVRKEIDDLSAWLGPEPV